LMKNLTYFFFALMLCAQFVACNDDDEGTMATDPTATIFERSSIDFIDGTGVESTIQIVNITDRGQGTGSVTLSNDTTYILNGFVFVNEGQTLTIEPGTVIKGAEGQGEDAAALVVARGAMIDACGTADNPIIFTSVAEPIFASSNGIVRNGNLDANLIGLWGGLIVLGEATINSTPGTSAVEGIPTDETRGNFGGSNDADNSGKLRYISVRHGGSDIGGGNEINGVTFGGVGSGTTVEFVEVFGNRDDGFEWFGGTVNTKNLVSAFNQDDAFDYDIGWRGNNQFWLAFQRISADRGGEHDGGTDPETASPFAMPFIANASFFGLGSGEGKRAITFRDNAGGHYLNSIFSGYENGVDIEYLGDETVEDSHNRFLAGELTFVANILTDVAQNPFTIAPANDDIMVPQAVQDDATLYFSNQGNTTVSDPMFMADGVTPTPGGVANSGLTTNPAGSFFTTVDYKGAVNPSTGPTWIAGWTRLSEEF
jgi:hypothetical protein